MAPKTVKEEDPDMLYLPKKEVPPMKDEKPYVPTDWSSYYEEDTKSRFKRKALENPFIPTGAILTTSNYAVI